MKAAQTKTKGPLAIVWDDEDLHLLERFIKGQAADGRTLQILEAGCGPDWEWIWPTRLTC